MLYLYMDRAHKRPVRIFDGTEPGFDASALPAPEDGTQHGGHAETVITRERTMAEAGAMVWNPDAASADGWGDFEPAPVARRTMSRFAWEQRFDFDEQRRYQLVLLGAHPTARWTQADADAGLCAARDVGDATPLSKLAQADALALKLLLDARDRIDPTSDDAFKAYTLLVALGVIDAARVGALQAPVTDAEVVK